MRTTIRRPKGLRQAGNASRHRLRTPGRPPVACNNPLPVPASLLPRASINFNLSLRPHSHFVDVAEDRRGDGELVRRLGLLPARPFLHLLADLFQLPGVEPVTAAARAFVHFHLPLGAEMAAFEFDVGALRAGALALEVHVQVRVPADVEKPGLPRLARLGHLLKLEGVEPDTAAAAAADIDGEFAHGQGAEFIEAGWAFHKWSGFGNLTSRRQHTRA